MKEIKIKGLKKISRETKTVNLNNGGYLQLNYNIKTGEAWTDYFVSLGSNSWKEYHDTDIINCGNIAIPMTMQAVKEMILDAVERRFING